MANSIIDLTSNDSRMSARIVWESSSNGSVANSSYVVGHLQVSRNDNYVTKGTWTGTMNIGGTVNNFNLPETSISGNWVTVLEFSIQKAHNNDGTGSCYFEAYVNGPAGTSLSSASASGSETVILDRIPRASNITCADGNIGSSTTININRTSNSFTHTLTYNFGDASGTIATKTANTSIGWTIPTSFYAQIPDSTNGQGTITCQTYSGNTLIGTSSCTFNAFVINSNPTVTATVIDSNSITTALTGDSNKLIKYFSNANINITATPKNSATITSRKVVCGDGKSSTSANSTLNSVENGTFSISCTDSRGSTASASISKTMINYIKLVFTSIALARTSTTSNTVNCTLQGNYFNGSFGSVANTLTLKWRYRLSGGTWSDYTTVTPTITNNTFSFTATLGTNFDYQQSYEFEFVADDQLMKNVKESKPVTQGKPIIDIGKNDVVVNGKINSNSGKIDGVFGQKATSTNNFNTMLTEGEYSIGGKLTNGPNGSASSTYYGKLIVKVNDGTTQNNSDNWLWQYFMNTGGILYYRRKINNGAFSDWKYYNMAGNNYTETVLYDNSSGTTGTVTLSETSSNFKYIEIFFGKSDYSSIKIPSPNGKLAELLQSYYGSTFQTVVKRISISGTSITVNTSLTGYFNFANGSTYAIGAENQIKIYKVVGYK